MKAKAIFTAALLLAAMTAWQQAWAQPTISTSVIIQGYTNGSQYVYAISGTGLQAQVKGPYNGAEMHFLSNNSDSNFTLERGINMSLEGFLAFANGSSLTDVTTNGSFKIVFTSTQYYFARVRVSPTAGADISGLSVNGMFTKTLTINIPDGTTFGRIYIDVATHTPLNYCTISGIEQSYVDYGQVCPEPIVTHEGRTLRKDEDYTLSYTQGTISGTVTVTGAGDYVGSNSKRYDLRQPALSDLHSLGTNIYEIASQQDMDYLARIVKGYGTATPSNDCSGKTFRQTADISYSYTDAWNVDTEENNFTPIGGYGYAFRGTFDGQGHTISGIRVYKDGSSASSAAGSLGLFGYVDGGTVKNVLLRDAVIRGYDNIGGLVGYLKNGIVTDCFLENTVVKYIDNYAEDYGIIADAQEGTNTITRAYYHDCAIIIGNKTADIVGDVFKLTSTSSVTLPARTGGTTVSATMTTYDDGVTLEGTRYYTEGATLALTYTGTGTAPSGYWIHFTATSGGVDKSAEVVYGPSLTMRTYDIVVGYEYLPVVSYIDGDGIEQQCSCYAIIPSTSVTLGADGTTRWYVVSSDADFSGSVHIKGDHVHLILSDGVTFFVRANGQENAVDIGGNFTIYGQQQGNGVLHTIHRGDYAAIRADGDITILGGVVNALSMNGAGFSTYGGNRTITLGWTRPANSIIATCDKEATRAYLCNTLKVKDGQAFWNGTAVLSGTISSHSKVNGKTLVPYPSGDDESSALTANQATFAGQTRYWATFYHPYWNFALPAGAQAFTMDSEHTLYRVGDGSVIPSDCAVIIMAEASALTGVSGGSGTLTLTATVASATPEDGNILQGKGAATPVSSLGLQAGQKVYVLGASGGTVGFFEFTGTDLPAGKAYYVQ